MFAPPKKITSNLTLTPLHKLERLIIYFLSDSEDNKVTHTLQREAQRSQVTASRIGSETTFL